LWSWRITGKKDRLGNFTKFLEFFFFLVGEENKTKEKLLDPRIGKLG
jgi:hypothetical protein